MSIINSTMGELTYADETGTPLEAEMGPGEGNFTMDGIEEGGWETEWVRNRGAFLERARVQEATVSGSITVFANGGASDGTAKTPVDAAMKTGAFASGVTKDPGGIVWSGTLIYVESRTVGGTTTTNTWTIPNARLKLASQEGTPANQRTFTYDAPGSAVTLVTATSP